MEDEPDIADVDDLGWVVDSLLELARISLDEIRRNAESRTETGTGSSSVETDVEGSTERSDTDAVRGEASEWSGRVDIFRIYTI